MYVYTRCIFGMPGFTKIYVKIERKSVKIKHNSKGRLKHQSTIALQRPQNYTFC